MNFHGTSNILTNEVWQKYFEELKAACSSAGHTIDNSDLDSDNSSYSSFLSGILTNIRSGEIDYCYTPEQIQDLLRYEPVRLESRYVQKENYFRVWLKSL